jgi:hypothetical protein
MKRRAQSYRAAPRKRRTRRANATWRELLTGHVALLLALGGVVTYAVLSVPYAVFYSTLGVGLDEVGFSYTNVLASAVGPILIAIAFSVLAWMVIGLIWMSSGREFGSRPALVAAFVAILFTLGVLFPYEGYLSARQVKRGQPVVRDFPSTALHAQNATIRPVAKPGNMPHLDAVSRRRLLYLGQSNSILVLYDYESDEAIYVPASQVVLRVNQAVNNT